MMVVIERWWLLIDVRCLVVDCILCVFVPRLDSRASTTSMAKRQSLRRRDSVVRMAYDGIRAVVKILVNN